MMLSWTKAASTAEDGLSGYEVQVRGTDNAFADVACEENDADDADAEPAALC
jgi:hypothetical protein